MRRLANIGAAGGRCLCFLALAPWLFGYAPHGSSPNGALWAKEHWREWRDAKIAWILQPDLDSPDGKILSRESVINKCASTYSEMGPLFGGPEALQALVQPREQISHFIQFVTAQRWMGVKDADGNKTHVLGSSLSDGQYLDSVQPFIQLPPLLASQPFLGALEHPSTYGKALAMIADANTKAAPADRWTALAYRSQFILSVDRATYGRLLVIVPHQKLADGSELEQWFQFALATPDTGRDAHLMSLSVVARVRRPDATVHSYFVDLFRRHDPESGRITLSSTFSMKPMPSSNCFNCHKTSVLPIHPKSILVCNEQGPSEFPADGNPIVAEVNRLALAYRGPEKLFVEPSDYGPSLGSGGPERVEASISKVTNGPELSPRIVKNITCASCHGSFAPLNFDLAVKTDRDLESFEGKKGLAQTYVESGYMPPGNDLTASERRTLWRALSQDYFDSRTGEGLFVDWLKGKS